MRLKHYVVIIVILVVAGVGIYFYTQQTKKDTNTSSTECVIRQDDPEEYLFKICNYLKENKDRITSNKNPDEYKIESIEEGTYSHRDNGHWVEEEVYVVRLDCCYTGDLAYIDKESGEVVGFSPGDM